MMRRWRATTARSLCGRTMPRRTTIAAMPWMELKRHDEALASYDRALTLRPDYAEAHYNRGNALEELKRHDEALASYDRALTLRPDHAEALNNRGIALQELKRLDERWRATTARSLCGRTMPRRSTIAALLCRS